MADDAAAKIDATIAGLGDWRGETLQRVREIVLAADDSVVETVKWVKPGNPGGVPVWESNGILCTGETYRKAVKLTFAKGASLSQDLFNASLEGSTRRAIDIAEGETVDADALTALIREAVALNAAKKR